MPNLREVIDKADNNSISTMLVADYLDKNFIIDEIEPLVHNDALNPTFTVYNANILFFGISTLWSLSPATFGIHGRIFLHDHLNAIVNRYGRNYPFWDVTAAAAKFEPDQILVENTYFSRVTETAYAHVLFQGYKLTIQ